MPHPQTEFGDFLSCLGYNCSFTVKNGVVTQVTFRLSTVEKRPATDASGLKLETLGGATLSFSITTKQSKEAGGVTIGGSSLTLPATVQTMSVNLGGQTQLSDDSTAGFVTLDGTNLTFDPTAPVGAVAKVGIKQSGGTKALVITKETADTIVIGYRG